MDEEYGIVYSANGPGLETTDGGLTWNDGGIEFAWDYHIANECDNMSIYSGFLRRQEECVWQEMEIFPFIEGNPQRFGRSIHFWDDEHYLIGAAGLQGLSNFTSIIKTMDGGETYSYLDFPFSSGTSAFSSLNDSTLLVATFSGSNVYHSLYYSEDYGETWIGIETPFTDQNQYKSIVDIQWMSEDLIYGRFGNEILRTTSGLVQSDVVWTGVPYVEENTSTSSLQIYPNPNKGSFQIQSKTFKEGEQIQVRLYSLRGDVVAAQSLNYTKGLLLNYRQVAKGMYVLQLVGEGNSVAARVQVE